MYQQKNREYSIKNKSKIKEYLKSYHLENIDTIKQQTKEYRKVNRTFLLKGKKKYYENNKTIILEKGKIYKESNKDKWKEYDKIYYKENKQHKIKIGILWNNSDALYESYKDKLTIDESPILHKDGISLEVKCRYCGKYFIPTNLQVSSRIQALNRLEGENSLYCSDGCKESCPIYNQKKWPKGHKPATSREVQPQLRQMVLKRYNYTCQKCGSTDTLHCHHIYPLNEGPITSADMDECITYCKSCHKWIHMNVAGCGYYEMGCIV